jgi:hypothetical protein
MAGAVVGYVEDHEGEAAPEVVQLSATGLGATDAAGEGFGAADPVAAPHPHRKTRARVTVVRRILPSFWSVG